MSGTDDEAKPSFTVITMAGFQTAQARRGPHARGLIAAMLTSFAVGQMAGSILASALARHGDDVSPALVIAALALIASAGARVRRARQ